MSRPATIALAAALAAMISVSAAQAKMGNINLAPKLGISHATPSMPDVKAHPVRIDARIKLNCYHTREPNELGVYVRRTHCG